MDACESTYIRDGDVSVCWLPLNHDGDHDDPARAAFVASLQARQAAAYAHWVF